MRFGRISELAPTIENFGPFSMRRGFLFIVKVMGLQRLDPLHGSTDQGVLIARYGSFKPDN